MDVLLDSNIYLEDVRMSGNQFEELFTYLRRTESRIFLPHLVREETAKKHAERMREASRKAQGAHENMWKIALSEGGKFAKPDLDQELNSLQKRMKSPSKGIKVVDVDDYGKVDLREVINRGIQRKRPASEEGEELRDVILWLLALDLASNSRSGVVFISKDKTFAASDGRTLHADLIQDISSRGVHLEFYPGIREFVVEKALAQEEIDSSRFYSFVPRSLLEEQTTKLMSGSTTRVGNITIADMREFQFERAIMYTVTDHSQFIEAQFSGSASLTVDDSGFFRYLNGLTDVGHSQFFSDVIPTSEPFFSFKPGVTLNPPATLRLFNQNVNPNETGSFTIHTSVASVRSYLCSFKIGFSVRRVDDETQSFETDGIQFTSFLLDQKSGESHR